MRTTWARRVLLGAVLTVPPCLLEVALATELPPVPATQPADPSPTLSLAELEAMALHGNPTLAQAAAIVEASYGKALQAGLYPNPTIGYIADQINAQKTPGEIQGGFVQQVIVTAHKLKLSRAKYDQEAREAEIRALGQQYRVLNGVKMRFYEVLATEQMLVLHRELLANAEESLRTHKEMHNTGQANKAEVLLSEVALNQARIALRTLENRYRTRWEDLIAVVGAPELCPRPLAGSLEPDGSTLDWESSWQRLLAESPELHFAQAHVVHDEIQLKREKAEPIPNVQVYANTGYNYETNNTVAGAQVGVVVPLWDRNQGTIRQAKADLSRSLAEVRRVELSLRRRLAQAFERYWTALETSQSYRDLNVPKATEAYEVQLEMYKKRRIAWPQVVALQRSVVQLRTEYLHSLLELRRAEIEIVGLLLVDGLTEPPGPIPGGHMEATPKPR